MKKTALFLVILIPALFLLAKGVQGQAVQSFTVIPPRLEIKAKPGETVTETVKFRNNSDNILRIVTFPQDFIVTDTSGTPFFVSEAVSGRWSASSWITLTPTSFPINPKQTKKVTLTVSIPPNALPGGHYAGILYQRAEIPIPKVGIGSEAGAGVAQIIGTLVYTTVEGPITEDAFVKRFEAPRFLEYGPVPFTTELANRSDIHIRPIGVIKIKNMIGRQVAKLDLEERNIFPGASYIYKNIWDKKYLFGRYSATLMASYGEQGLPLTATIYFWVFPWKVATAVVLAVIIILLITFLIYRYFKRREEELEAKLEEEEKEVEELKEKLEKKSE